MPTSGPDGFAAYYAARYRALRRTAYLLCGDWHEAEDLTQAAFVRLYLAWGRVRADGAHAYARRVLLNEFLGGQRRPRGGPGGRGAGPAGRAARLPGSSRTAGPSASTSPTSTPRPRTAPSRG